MRSEPNGCLVVIVAMVIVVAALAALALVTMFAWNAFAPVIHGPHLSYGAAFAAIVLLAVFASFFRRVAVE